MLFINGQPWSSWTEHFMYDNMFLLVVVGTL